MLFAKQQTFCFVIMVSFFTISLNAETIILRNGKKIDGKVLGHDSESVTISVDGTSKTIPKTEVYKVIFSSGNSELRKFLSEKKGEKTLNKFDGEDALDIDENTADKKELTHKLSQLEKKIDKLEKKMTRLKDKITRLRAKIKEKDVDEPKKHL